MFVLYIKQQQQWKSRKALFGNYQWDQLFTVVWHTNKLCGNISGWYFCTY